ncbi:MULTISPECIES: PRTRC system protein E [Methylomonas]|uniref:PRTRC system protein E n=1 Tax=Methylomonas koyamae TaxID=702114 RepID=A0A177P4K3_9GAMM|nr:PRTRC system protein E [Methylomonas koyamae]OAI25175.1 hypothetical protein A1355_19910 [Methylomonas koyamae]
MFQTFQQLLGDNEKIQFSVSRTSDGQLAVLIQPVFNGAGANPDDSAIADLRASLSTPLHIIATANELDAGFPRCLTQYVQGIAAGKGALDNALERIKEGGKQVKAAADRLADASVSDSDAESAASDSKRSSAKSDSADVETDRSISDSQQPHSLL